MLCGLAGGLSHPIDHEMDRYIESCAVIVSFLEKPVLEDKKLVSQFGDQSSKILGPHSSQ